MKPIDLSCRVFFPSLVVCRTLGRDRHENFDELFTREIVPFIRYNSQARVINFEIVPITGNENRDSMSTPGLRRPYVLIASARVYFDGPISEPPAGVIQQRPPPVQETVECCVIA